MEIKHAREIETASPNLSVFSAERWGLPLDAVKDMGHDLHQIWQRYHDCWVTRKHDNSDYALIYLKGLSTTTLS